MKKNVLGYSYAYLMITVFYGEETAARSGVPLINHIDEGIAILKEINASHTTIAAYCLHPMLQSDEALVKAVKERVFGRYSGSEAVILAMEYRRVANAYLSRRQITSIEEIELSPLLEVNQMLWADKLQNQKDFRAYHLGTHPRSAELEQYFINWIERLKPVIQPC